MKIKSLSDLKKNFEFTDEKSAWVMGSAPSVQSFNYSGFNGIRIGVGDMPWRAPELGPYDFWVTANTIFPLPWRLTDTQLINQKAKYTLISPICVLDNKTPEVNEMVLKSIIENANIIPYDTKHFFKAKNCTPKNKCCFFSEKMILDLTIQEQLSEMVGVREPAYSTGGTVALHGFALAVLLNANPIYISGIELPTKNCDYIYINKYKKYIYESSSEWLYRLANQFRPNWQKKDTDFSEKTYVEILDDFQKIAEIANLLKIEVLSTSSTSPLNSLPGFRFIG
jgi:hypothetical protein